MRMRKQLLLRKLLTMRKLLTFVLILLITLQFASCKKGKDIPESPDPTSYNPSLLDNSSNNNGSAENNSSSNDSLDKNNSNTNNVSDENNSSPNNQTGNNFMSNTALELGITHENYPRIDGSTSTLAIVQAINRAMYKSDNNENFPEAASKTVPSYKMLINEEADMIIVPYASSDVLALAEEAGVELEFCPIAAEALVFITPKENTAENITMEQVRKIYIGYGITNWSELNGPDRELVPICRNSDSGSQSQMDNLILKGEKMHSKIQENYVELTMEGMLEQVAFYHQGGLFGKPTNSYALGYTLYTYLKSMGEITGIDRELKMLAFEGVVPSEQSIAEGSYSLADAYYAVVRSDLPKEHSARKIIDWLKSDDGKAIIKELGLIPKE